MTVPTLYSWLTGSMATAKMELAKVTTNVIKDMEIVMATLRRTLQFLGFPGSSGPSNSTRSGRFSGCAGVSVRMAVPRVPSSRLAASWSALELCFSSSGELRLLSLLLFVSSCSLLVRSGSRLIVEASTVAVKASQHVWMAMC